MMTHTAAIKRIAIPLVVFLFLAMAANAMLASGKGYKITVKLQGSNDTLLMLAHYMGSKQYLDDTAFLGKNGVFVFEGDKKLPEGLYLVAGQNKTRYFDFFLTGNQQVEFTCHPQKVTETMQVKGSEENRLFYAYIRYLAERQAEIDPFRKGMANNKGRSDSLAFYQARVDTIDARVKKYIRSFYTQNAPMLLAHFIQANTEPDITTYITRADGSVDSSRIYQAYKQHYFDNFTFSDPRLYYTPVLTAKVDYYLDKLTVPVLDSVLKETARLMDLSLVNPETAKYMAWHLLVKYGSSEIMGHDAIYVAIVQNYLENGKVEWMYDEVKDREIKRAKTLSPLLLGKQAPNMVMLDTLNIARALYSVKARYTLVFFWESTCGHCQKEMPNVLKVYDELHNLYDFEIFGVSGDTSLVKWKQYMVKNNMKWINVNGHLSLSGDYHDLYDIHSTPVMYLLDENKKILAKFLLSEQMADLVRKREEARKKE